MKTGVEIAALANGLTVIVEEMDHVESSAYTLLIPGGSIHDPDEALGCGVILSELTSRGAGDFDSRSLAAEFDRRGIRRSESCTHDSFCFRGA